MKKSTNKTPFRIGGRGSKQLSKALEKSNEERGLAENETVWVCCSDDPPCYAKLISNTINGSIIQPLFPVENDPSLFTLSPGHLVMINNKEKIQTIQMKQDPRGWRVTTPTNNKSNNNNNNWDFVSLEGSSIDDTNGNVEPITITSFHNKKNMEEPQDNQQDCFMTPSSQDKQRESPTLTVDRDESQSSTDEQTNNSPEKTISKNERRRRFRHSSIVPIGITFESCDECEEINSKFPFNSNSFNFNTQPDKEQEEEIENKKQKPSSPVNIVNSSHQIQECIEIFPEFSMMLMKPQTPIPRRLSTRKGRSKRQ